MTWLLSADPSPSASYPASTVRSSFRGHHRSWSSRRIPSRGPGAGSQVAEPAAGRRRHAGRRLGVRGYPAPTGYYTSARTLAALRPPGAAWGSRSRLLSDPAIEGSCPHARGSDPTARRRWCGTSYDGANDKIATRVHARAVPGSRSQTLTQSVDSESDPQLVDGRRTAPPSWTFRNLANGIGVAIRPPGGEWRPTDFVAPAAQTGYERSARGRWRHRRGPVDLRQRLRSLMAVVADNLLPLPPLPKPTAETGKITGPKKIEKGKKASYAFTGTPASVTFECRVDKTRAPADRGDGAEGEEAGPVARLRLAGEGEDQEAEARPAHPLRACRPGRGPRRDSVEEEVQGEGPAGIVPGRRPSDRCRAAPAGRPAGRASR